MMFSFRLVYMPVWLLVNCINYWIFTHVCDFIQVLVLVMLDKAPLWVGHLYILSLLPEVEFPVGLRLHLAFPCRYYCIELSLCTYMANKVNRRFYKLIFISMIV